MPDSGQRSSAVDQRFLGEVLRQPDVADHPHETTDQPGGLDPPDRLDGLAQVPLRPWCGYGLALALDLGAQALFLRAQLGRELLAEVLGLEDRADLDLRLLAGHRIAGSAAPTRPPRPST